MLKYFSKLTFISLSFAALTASNAAPATKVKKTKSTQQSTPSPSTPSSSATPAATPSTSSENVPTTSGPETQAQQFKPVEFDSKNIWSQDIFQRSDHKVLIIQDRKYTKAKKFDIGLHGGLHSASPFYTSISYGGTLGYHFNEYFAAEGFYNTSSNSKTADAKQIDQFLAESGFSSTKEYQRPLSFAGFGLMWSPIYGKFAFFRKSIIHFDIFAEAGASVIKIKTNLNETGSAVDAARGGRDQTRWGSLVGVGTRVFISDRWSLRFDVRNNIYTSYFAPTTAALAGKTLTRTSFQFSAGLSFLLGR